MKRYGEGVGEGEIWECRRKRCVCAGKGQDVCESGVCLRAMAKGEMG